MHCYECDAAEKPEGYDDPATAEEDEKGNLLLKVEFRFVYDLRCKLVD